MSTKPLLTFKSYSCICCLFLKHADVLLSTMLSGPRYVADARRSQKNRISLLWLISNHSYHLTLLAPQSPVCSLNHSLAFCSTIIASCFQKVNSLALDTCAPLSPFQPFFSSNLISKVTSYNF